jgi:hypothetical protein
MSLRDHEPQRRWSVMVSGQLHHEIDDATSEDVPPGRYTLDEFDWGVYRMSREGGGPRFILSRREIGAYIMRQQMTPLDGAWP